MLPVLKILTPKVIKAIMSYVFENNNLDEQMEVMQKRVAKLENTEYVLCSQCKNKIKQYEGTD